MYGFCATISFRNNEGWLTIRQLPTFYMDGSLDYLAAERQAENFIRDCLPLIPDDLQISVASFKPKPKPQYRPQPIPYEDEDEDEDEDD